MLYEKIFVPGHVIPDNDIVDRSVFIDHGRLVSYNEPVREKTNNVDSEQVLQKSSCTVSEAG